MVEIVPSTRKDKKYMARFADGTITHFGQKGAKDFILWSRLVSPREAERRRDVYVQRHRAREDWTKPRTAGALSRWILWNKPTFRASYLDFRRRFRM